MTLFSRPLTSTLVAVLSVIGFFSPALAAVDSGFNASLTKIPGGMVNRILVLPDGKILVAGSFRVASNQARTALVRLNSNGSLDTSFAPSYYENFSGQLTNVHDIELQSDGKIIVGGDFFEVNGSPKYRLIRLSSNGTVDDTFAQQPISSTVLDIVVLPDDKMLVGGAFTYVAPTGDRQRLVRLNADGSLDPTINFSPVSATVNSIAVQSTGNTVVATGTSIVRYTTTGALDATFSAITCNGQVVDIKAQADGKLLIGGLFSNVNTFGITGFFRAFANGGVDGSFFTNASVNGGVLAINILADQRVVIGGSFTNYGGVPRNHVALIGVNGERDAFYNPVNNPIPIVHDVSYQPDGKILLGGITDPATENPILVRTNVDGSIDSGFSPSLGLEGIGARVRVQPDGKILAVGQFWNANGSSRRSIARFNADGSLDAGFTPPPVASEIVVTGLDLQPDGRILVVGTDEHSGVEQRIAARLNVDGTTNVNFASLPFPRDIRALFDGRVLIADGSGVHRFAANGSFESTFASISGGGVYRMAIQQDGKVIIVGNFTLVNGVQRSGIARLQIDGALDMGFNPGGGANAKVSDVVIQPDGKIIIGGEFTGFNFDLNRQYLARLNSDGSLDGSYTPVVNGPVSSLRLEPNAGKLLLGGDFTQVNNISRARFARLNVNGSVDPTFTDGTNGTVLSIDLQSDGKIVYAGRFTLTNGISTLGIGRLLKPAAPVRTPFDFDGDGKADISVYRSSTNRWYEVLSSSGVPYEETFGSPGDIIAPADFDGDGKTDESIYRPGNGHWVYHSSVFGTIVEVPFGSPGDIPRPSDFDGDGKDDRVIFRPSLNTWFRFSSLANQEAPSRVFGQAGDQPLVGDFDGDGKSDLAIFRPASGDWWYAASSANDAFRTVHWGQNGDIPVPADFDGDGKTDYAVYRPSEGGWYIYNSSNGSFTTTAFGLNGDRPVAADYDGDGRADISVFRPSTGIWYILRSTSGFLGYQFGISTDTAIPGSLIP